MTQATVMILHRSIRVALILALLTLPAYLIACSGTDTAEVQAGTDVRTVADKSPDGSSKTHDMGGEMPKSDSEWKEILTEEQFRVTRQCGTEPAFTGKYYKHKGDGTYLCVCCGNELFSSDTKYESGSGWPSFWSPKDSANILEEADMSLGMARTEIKCSKCGAHLGHVFEDGPQPSGLRYCVNSAALNFVGDEKGDKQKQDE